MIKKSREEVLNDVKVLKYIDLLVFFNNKT